MSGLKAEIANGIRMFKPQNVKEDISLEKMRDDQVSRHRGMIRPNLSRSLSTSSNSRTIQVSTPETIKRLSWDEMQKRRAQGLCFNCNDKFNPGHRCQAPQLTILENIVQEDVISKGYLAHTHRMGHP